MLIHSFSFFRCQIFIRWRCGNFRPRSLQYLSTKIDLPRNTSETRNFTHGLCQQANCTSASCLESSVSKICRMPNGSVTKNCHSERTPETCGKWTFGLPWNEYPNTNCSNDRVHWEDCWDSRWAHRPATLSDRKIRQTCGVMYCSCVFGRYLLHVVVRTKKTAPLLRVTRPCPDDQNCYRRAD